MRRAIIFSTFAGVLAVTLGLADTPERSVADPSELAQLRTEIAELRRRIEGLEQHLRDRVIIPAPEGEDGQRPLIIDPFQNRGLRPVPPDWKPFDFNGARFYVIPIENAVSGVATRQE